MVHSHFAARSRYLESIAEENNNSTESPPSHHDRTYTPIMDFSEESGLQLQPPRQREPRRRSQIPSPVKPRGASNPPPRHPRTSSLSVPKLRQNFQQQDQAAKPIRAISPTLTPVTKLAPKPLNSSSVNSYVSRTRLPAQRRVATTPTTSLTPISEMRQPLPKSTPKYLYGDGFTTPLDSRRTFTPPKTMSPSVSTTPTPKSGTRTRRSQTTSGPLTILESKDEDTPENSFRARARRSLTTLEHIKALKSGNEDDPGSNTPKESMRSKNASPADALSARGSLRFSSVPQLPSEKKENQPPSRLLGPISPARAQQAPIIPKSRTFGMLSSLSSSFSRSSMNLHNRQSSLSTSQSSLHLMKAKSTDPFPTSSPTTAVSETTADPFHTSNFSNLSKTSRAKLQPPATPPDPRQMFEARPAAFWCGRFVSVRDRYMNEMMEVAMHDSEKYKSLVGPLGQDESEEQDFQEKKRNYHKLLDEHQDLQNAGLSSGIVLQVKEDRVALKVFKEIQDYCVTEEARKSFWWWQLRYAREQKNEAYLPKGGAMKDNWVSQKAEQFLKIQRDDLGRKTSFGSRFSKTRAESRSRDDSWKGCNWVLA